MLDIAAQLVILGFLYIRRDNECGDASICKCICFLFCEIYKGQLTSFANENVQFGQHLRTTIGFIICSCNMLSVTNEMKWFGDKVHDLLLSKIVKIHQKLELTRIFAVECGKFPEFGHFSLFIAEIM